VKCVFRSESYIWYGIYEDLESIACIVTITTDKQFKTISYISGETIFIGSSSLSVGSYEESLDAIKFV
jgi:hypothetical protein